MKKLLFIWLVWVVIGGLSAQNNKCADMSALLENKVWKVQLSQDKKYAMEMELFILILYAEIQSKSLNRGKITLSKS